MFLFFRMLLIMGVSLFTTRLVLETLGVEDFGIYNVVGGIVLLLTFLNSAMVSATQRFLSFELGRKNYFKLRKTFSISINLHILIGVLVLLLAETVGLWFLNTKMNIPEARMEAARWVYQFSIFSFLISIIRVTYNAAIIANEKMSFFAYNSILESILKLLVVFTLVWSGDIDKMKLYSILTFTVTTIVTAIYICYCFFKFKECRYYYVWDKKIFNSLINFSGWSIFGSFSWVLMNQGVNILLNVFFEPTINAARAIAFQVNSSVSLLVTNFKTAVNPQIIKSHSSGDKHYMDMLVFESSKYSYYLILLLVLPFLLETETILNLWLNSSPDYAIIFSQLLLVNTLFQSFDIGIVFTAIGKIKANQFFGGMTYLLVLPLSYVFVKCGYPPEITFFINIAATIVVNFFINIILLKKYTEITPYRYFDLLLSPILKVTIISCLLPLLINLIIVSSTERLLLTTFTSILSVLSTVYFFGINNKTRNIILRATKNLIRTRLLNKSNNSN